MRTEAGKDELAKAVRRALARLRGLYGQTDAPDIVNATAELAAIVGFLQQVLDKTEIAAREAGEARFEAELRLRGHGRRSPRIGTLLIHLWLRDGAAILSDQGVAELNWMLKSDPTDPSSRR